MPALLKVAPLLGSKKILPVGPMVADWPTGLVRVPVLRNAYLFPWKSMPDLAVTVTVCCGGHRSVAPDERPLDIFVDTEGQRSSGKVGGAGDVVIGSVEGLGSPRK